MKSRRFHEGFDGRRTRSASLLAPLLALSAFACVAACTSGSTPDCSGDAAAACDPFEGGLDGASADTSADGPSSGDAGDAAAADTGADQAAVDGGSASDGPEASSPEASTRDAAGSGG